MIVTHKINIDLTLKRIQPAVPVMQDDKYSRNLEIALTANGVVWEIPSDAVAIVRFKKSDGTGGNYDTLPNGETAYSIEGSVITVALASQVCTAPGHVKLAVGLISGDAEVNTFTVDIEVFRNPGLDVQSENYSNVTSFVSSSGWPANMFLGTDEDGNVIAKAAAGGASSWNDLTDKPFYEESGEVELYSDTLTGLNGKEGAVAIIPAPFVLVEGETYRVVLDGVEHALVCTAAQGFTGIYYGTEDESGSVVGGFDIMYGAPEITDTDGGVVGLQFYDTADTHTIAIYHNGTVIKPIDNKYLAPFHVEGGKTYMMEEQTFDGFVYNDEFGSYAKLFDQFDGIDPFVVVVGETYKVTWDDITYSVVAQDVSAALPGAIGLGNCSAFGLSGNNEPFVILWAEAGASFIVTDGSESTSHKVGIYQGSDPIWKLNEECLPMDAIDARIEEYISTALEGDY